MTGIARPAERPARPHFSSGPCAKRPGWTPRILDDALLGRSHRAAPGLAKLREALALTREVLQIPESHLIAITPGSDTGAVEMALWSLLGQRGVDVVAWEAFGKDWVTDVLRELKITDAHSHVAPYGQLPDLAAIDFARDVVFTWNGTTSGVRVPSADVIPADREGLTICDATSAVFAQALDWSKLDVTTFSWQKAVGGEAAHGMLVVGPRAVTRLESFTPDRPMPKLFRMVEKGKLNKSFFDGSTINTPSLLCVEDYLDTLRWGKGLGGLAALRARADASFSAIDAWVARTAWIDLPRRGASDPLEHERVPEGDRSGAARRRRRGGVLQGPRQAARGGEGRLRHRLLSRRTDGPAHLVRADGRGRGRRRAHPLARLGARDAGRAARRCGVRRAPSFSRLREKVAPRSGVG